MPLPGWRRIDKPDPGQKMVMMATVAYIALGANLGDRQKSIGEALLKLEGAPGVNIGSVSTLIENPAVGGPPDSPAFLNAAAEVITSLDAPGLMKTLLQTERDMGRVRSQPWGPRIIDLDLLLFGDLVLNSNDLTVPHPRMAQRRFVLAPLAQIAPQAVHPLLKKTIARLLSELEAD